MSVQTAEKTNRDRLPYVDTWMNFAGDIKGRARVDVGDWSQTNLVLDKRDVRIFDARPIRDELSFNREGFRLVDHDPGVDLSGDLAPVAEAYLASVAGLLKRLSGADMVLAQGTGLLKRYAERANIKGAIGPSRWVHADYTEKWAHVWVDWIEGWQNQKLKQFPRFAVFQTWRCISKPPQDNIFVLCDATTINSKDLIVFDACMRKPYDAPGNQFESQLCKYDPNLRWYYFSNLKPDELIIWQAFDGKSGCTHQPLHNSADVPGLVDAEPRCSIEARFFAFWK